MYCIFQSKTVMNDGFMSRSSEIGSRFFSFDKVPLKKDLQTLTCGRGRE
jgi:hypothetical protein